MKREYLKKLLMCILVLSFAAISIGATKFSKVYDNATQLMVDGDYAGAAELFDSIASYEDASSLSMYCKANLLAEQGNYDEAVSAFEFFGDYKDCKYLVVYYSACKLEAEAAQNPEQYLEAADKFRTISLFRDSSTRSEQCKQKLYAVAQGYLDKEEYQDAFAFFRLLDGFSDSTEKMKACKYGVASSQMNEGNYSTAASMFAELGEYLDSPNLLEKTRKLANLEFDHRFLLMDRGYNDICEYDDAAFYLGDTNDNLFDYYGLSIVNKGSEKIQYTITCELDGVGYSWETSELDAGKTTIFPFTSTRRPDHFLEGEHTCIWYVDEVPVFNDSYLVYDKASEERIKEVTIAESMDVELSVAQYDENATVKLSWYTQEDRIYMKNLRENNYYVLVVKITNPTDESVPVFTSAVIDGENVSWNSTDLESEDFMRFYSSNVLNVGTHRVEAFVNGIKVCEWAFDITDNDPSVDSAESLVDSAEIKVGDIYSFGSYEQDDDLSDGNEPIEWLVLDVKDDKVLLISKYALDSRQYNTDKADLLWESSMLRAWLNSTFIGSAFSTEEQNAIMTTRTKNEESQGDTGSDSIAVDETEDRVFLLSHQEVIEYFSSESDRRCIPTQTTTTDPHLEYVKYFGTCHWWLRTIEKEQYVEIVTTEGEFSGNGADSYTGVRPAMWVDLSKMPLSSKTEARVPSDITEDTTAILDSSTEEPSGRFIPGIYRASATGMGTVTLTVTVDENSITAIEIDGSGETPGIGSVAVERLPSVIVAANTWDVDGISGATITSTAIREAVKAALEEAEIKGDSIETYPDSNPDMTIQPVPAFPSSLTAWQQQFSENGLSTLVIDDSLPDYSSIGVSEDDIESIWAIFFPDTGNSGLVLYLSAKDSEIAEKVYSNLLNVFGVDSLDSFSESYGEHGAVTFEDNDNNYLRIINDQEGTALILQRSGNNIGALGYFGDNDTASEVKSICRNFGMIPE